MKKLFAAALLFATCTLQASPIDELLALNDSEQQMKIIRHNLNSALVRSNPPLADYQEILTQWAESYLTWEEIKPKIADVSSTLCLYHRVVEIPGGKITTIRM